MTGCVGCPPGSQTRCVVAPHPMAWGWLSGGRAAFFHRLTWGWRCLPSLGLTVCLRVFFVINIQPDEKEATWRFWWLTAHWRKLCHVAIPTCPRSWGCGLGKYPWKGENESVDSPAWHHVAPAPPGSCRDGRKERETGHFTLL